MPNIIKIDPEIWIFIKNRQMHIYIIKPTLTFLVECMRYKALKGICYGNFTINPL